MQPSLSALTFHGSIASAGPCSTAYLCDPSNLPPVMSTMQPSVARSTVCHLLVALPALGVIAVGTVARCGSECSSVRRSRT